MNSDLFADLPPGRVIWITGLSASGKSTVARLVARTLLDRGVASVLLDGDELRALFPGGARFERPARLELAGRYQRLCALLAGQGLTVVIATVSLFKEVHAWNRRHLPGYTEVYLRVPPEELRRRDPAGLYAAQRAGELRHLPGVDQEVDLPRAPHLTVDNAPPVTASQAAREVMRHLGLGHRRAPR